MLSSDDEVTFPVPRYRATFYLLWSLMDAYHIGYFASFVSLPLTPFPALCTLSEVGDEFLPECSPREHIDVGVDTFVGDLHSGVPRIGRFEVLSNLLR